MISPRSDPFGGSVSLNTDKFLDLTSSATKRPLLGESKGINQRSSPPAGRLWGEKSMRIHSNRSSQYTFTPD